MDTLIKEIVGSGRTLWGRGIHFLFKTFIAPRSKGEERRQEYILNIILCSSLLVLLGLDASVVYYSLREGSAYQEISFPIFSLLPLFFIILYFLSRHGWFRLASYLLIAAYFVANSYAAYRWGVDLQAAILGYALLIIISSILIDTGFGFWITGLIATYIIPLWYLQWNDRLPRQPIQSNPSDGVVFSTLYLLVMIVAWLSNREIERSLGLVKKSEAELKTERDSLEIKIGERTRELQEAQRIRIEQLYRFAEFGRLASGLFHDLVNLLNVVILRTEEGATTKKSLSEVREVIKRVEVFTQAMRKQLSNREEEELFSIIEGIEQVLQLFSYKAVAEKVQLVVERDPDFNPRHFGSQFKFHQVLFNLLLNAIESCQEVAADFNRKHIVTVRVVGNGEAVKIAIVDNGCGIPETILPKIFESFFTTKGTGGMGVGLATVKQIVEQDFGGSIRVESQEGRGSTFTVTFSLRSEGRSRSVHEV